jgi:hypothetical protein
MGFAALLIILRALFADATLTEFDRERILCSVLLPCSYCVGIDDQVTTAFMFFRTGEWPHPTLHTGVCFALPFTPACGDSIAV